VRAGGGAAADRLRRHRQGWQLRTPRSQGGYDNGDPRAWLARQTDWRARANAAQANSFEALPFFIGAVVMAHQLGRPPGLLDILAFVFVVLRVVYILLYVGGQASARSLVWTLALAVNIASCSPATTEPRRVALPCPDFPLGISRSGSPRCAVRVVW
jgi:uncharacterized MAPEG superfamily protein